MDDELKWLVGGFMAFILALIGACVISDTMEHAQKMECMKARGDWSDKACRFSK